MQKAKSAVESARTPAGDDTDRSALLTPSDLAEDDRGKIAKKINGLVADAYVLYVKTKNFHWHMAGPHFRDYHLMLDEQSDQIFATIDPLAERVRKLGNTIRSLAQTLAPTSLEENDELFVSSVEMLTSSARTTWRWPRRCARRQGRDDANDVATASLLEIYIAKRRSGLGSCRDRAQRRSGWPLIWTDRSPFGRRVGTGR